MQRAGQALVLLGIVNLLAGGCAGSSQPAASPTARALPRLEAVRIGVVDLERVLREHPRAAELGALRQRILDVEAALRTPLPPPRITPPTLPDVTSGLREAFEERVRAIQERIRAQTRALLEQQAASLRRTYQEELRVLEQQGRLELERFAQQVQAEQQEMLRARQQEIQAELERTVEERRKQLEAETRAYEEQVAKEYRIPLLNIRLKLETVQLTSREEANQLVAEYERLQRERDEKIRKFQEEQRAAFEAFAEHARAKANETLKSYARLLEAQARRRIAERQQAIRRRLEAAAKEREQRFRQEMQARQRELEARARAQAEQEAKAALEHLRAEARARQQSALQQARRTLQQLSRRAEARYREEERARVERLTQTLAALREQQQNLQETILAELRVEAAAVALDRKLDVVLVQYVSAPSVVDITDDVLRRLHRR